MQQLGRPTTLTTMGLEQAALEPMLLLHFAHLYLMLLPPLHRPSPVLASLRLSSQLLFCPGRPEQAHPLRTTLTRPSVLRSHNLCLFFSHQISRRLSQRRPQLQQGCHHLPRRPQLCDQLIYTSAPQWAHLRPAFGLDKSKKGEPWRISM